MTVDEVVPVTAGVEALIGVIVPSDVPAGMSKLGRITPSTEEGVGAHEISQIP